MSYAHLYRHFCSQIVEIKFKKWKIWICVLLQVLLLVVVVVVLGGGWRLWVEAILAPLAVSLGD